MRGLEPLENIPSRQERGLILAVITVMNRDSEEFHTKLTAFYNTGDATEMMKFFEKTVATLYPRQETGAEAR